MVRKTVEEAIKKLRAAWTGREVRDRMADTIEAMNEEVTNTSSKQSILEETFNNLIINEGNSNAEVVAARVDQNGNSYDTLGKRMNNFDEQLDTIDIQKASKIYVDSKIGNMGNTKTFKGNCLYSELPISATVDDYWYISDRNTNYCWNGSEWVDIGNNLNIGDNTITPLKTTFIDVKTSINLINPNNVILDYYLANNTSKEYEGAFYSEKITVNEGDIVRCAYFSTFVSYPGTIFLKDGSYINIKDITDFTISESMSKYNNATFRYWTITIPENAVSIVVNGIKSSLNNSFILTINNELPEKFVNYEEINKLKEDIELPIFYEKRLEELESNGSVTPEKTTFIYNETSINVFNKEKAELGKYQKNGIIITEDANYYLVKINVNENDIIRVTYNPNLASNPCHVFNAEGVRIANMSQLTDYVVTDSKYWSATMPIGSSYIIVNGQVSYIDKNMIVINNEYPNEYIPYYNSKKLDDNIQVSLAVENKKEITYLRTLFTTNTHNILENKVWVVCGDSISWGYAADLDEEGNRKTYQYYIGKRNNMTVITDAISGSTMMNVEGRNPFSVDRYMNLPEKIDYLTLAFVTNDSSQSLDLIGTINDTTNSTFYGAWNIVLKYLIEKYPTTKIQVIGFWRGNNNYQYTDALRNICKKFRVKFLDFMFDNNIPLIGGSDNRSYNPNAVEPYTDYNTLIARRNTFLADTVHLNDIGYQYVSTIIEDDLRSI